MSFGETSIFIKRGHALAAGMKLFNKRFQLERPLGSGGMGQVWLAQDSTLGQPRAMKFIATALMQDQGAKRRLMQEALAGTTLSHPRIVRVYDYMEDMKRGISAIIMEYVPGRTLAELLGESQSGFLEPAQVHRHIMDVADGLRYAHEEKRRYHLDLKPSNIIIDAVDGRARLLDFGISRTAKDATTRITGGNSSGTLPYMSPQQMVGEAPCAADDYYGLAATLYELLTGTPPFFRGEIGHQVLHRTVERVVERRRKNCVENLVHRTGGTVPEAWEALVTGWLSKDPAQRLATLSMQDLALGRLPPPVAQTGPAPTVLLASPPPASRRYLLPAAAAACALALAAAAVPQIWPARVAEQPPRRPLKTIKELEIERRLEEERQQRAAAEERQRHLEEELEKLQARQLQESTAAREAEIQKKAAELAAAQLMAREQEQARLKAEADRAAAEQAARLAEQTITPGIPFTISGLGVMSWIPEGEFTMGSDEAERRALATGKNWSPAKVADEKPHRVRLTQGCWMAADEVTLEQYLAFLNASAAQPDTVFSTSRRWLVRENPCCPVEHSGGVWRLKPPASTKAAFWSNPRQPMICVTWHGARAFCDWFTQAAARAGKLTPGWAFTLPTEAQWERACRAETSTMFVFGGSISSAVANFDSMHPVGSALASPGLGHPHPTAAPRLSHAAPGVEVRVLRSRAAVQALDPRFPTDHPWWLHDMHGNVWEWCLDWYGEYETPSLAIDPTGAETGQARVLRGGGWKSPGWACRSAVRNFSPPAGGLGDEETGFRVALARTGR